MKKKKKLRIGFTTGSAAAAALKAAILNLFGRNIKLVDIPTPSGKRLKIPVHTEIKAQNYCNSWVIKDGGDDPDVTHGALIGVRVVVEQMDHRKINIFGGHGIGIVTKPGLPVKIGEAAINPVPRKQILMAAYEALDELGIDAKITAIFYVEDGENLAKKTLNPRLGVKGGISILGTRGTVIPYSAEAYKDSIILAMDVAKSLKIDHICLSTGGRSERLLRSALPLLRQEAFIQIADYFEFSLKQAAKKGFFKVSFGVFPGKLFKMAQGNRYTHAKDTKIDFELLSKWAGEVQYPVDICNEIKKANTGRHVTEILKRDKDRFLEFIKFVCKRAKSVAKEFSDNKLNVNYYVFDYSEEPIIFYE